MFELGIEPDVITFNTLINGSCVERKVFESRRVFDDMVRDGFHLDLITYSTLENGLCKIGKSGEAVRLMQRMEEGGFLPNIVISVQSLTDFAMCGSRKWKVAKSLLDEIVGRTIKPDVVAYNIITDTLSKEGMVSKAQDVVEAMIREGI
ncbi:hypothetical protein SLEP1_g36980 [Rubroshorea leprosula]|uniref:Pentatricopeptide repeat-containing protein n=1 Tax=Rubroshorea leprosula TaxID=152421 RepID=A0AAV5KTN9_9ROSI|nr:hypothetical protein SLEP1_g36980 [Rubroshorea leprosula]